MSRLLWKLGATGLSGLVLAGGQALAAGKAPPPPPGGLWRMDCSVAVINTQLQDNVETGSQSQPQTADLAIDMDKKSVISRSGIFGVDKTFTATLVTTSDGPMVNFADMSSSVASNDGKTTTSLTQSAAFDRVRLTLKVERHQIVSTSLTADGTTHTVENRILATGQCQRKAEIGATGPGARSGR